MTTRVRAGCLWAAISLFVPMAGAQQPRPDAARPPELIDITPAFGPAGPAYPLQATIRGTGFMPTGNVVEFGPVTISDVPSTDGTQITFAIPKLVASGGEVSPFVLQPGEYRVTVRTGAVTSNALIFTFTRSR